MNSLTIPAPLLTLKSELGFHPLFSKLNNIEDLRIFMQGHVFAVWDFMSLLKSLQREISCVEVPWRPSPYSKAAVRLINEIVLGEESDLDAHGEAMDHFTMYLEAMKEVGANTAPIYEFLSTLDVNLVPDYAREFVSFNLELATRAPAHQVAGAFFFGREDVIPTMFDGILKQLELAQIPCPQLRHYLTRHIELDGGEHGPMAQQMLLELTNNDDQKLQSVFETGLTSLKLRKQLWSNILLQLNRG